MKPVAVTQRVVLETRYPERRDALDQRWATFLHACGLLAVPMPNDPDVACDLFHGVAARGLLLTGGNDPVALGGDAPERDATEAALIDLALAEELPIVGICRGMQMIQQRFDVPLERVSGHVTSVQRIRIGERWETVNSYHSFGARESVPELEVWARAEDDLVKAVRHHNRPIVGMMWHPERLTPFRDADKRLLIDMFGVETKEETR